MNTVNNYIINTWNLTLIKNIDFNKTNVINITGNSTLHLYLIAKDTTSCPYCGYSCYYIHSSKKQLIKHILSNQSYAEIVFHKRIYKCNSCGYGFSDFLGDFISSRGVSIFLELAILKSMKNLSLTYKMITSMYNISDTFVCGIFDRHVSIPPLTLPYVLCVDEIYARRLTSTKYCCALFDPIENKLIDILYSRRKDLLEPYFLRKSKEEKSVVKYFVCDLNDTYHSIAYKYFKGITVVADNFHVIKNLSDAFRQIRIRVMKKHEEMRNETMEYWLLKKFDWMLEMSIDDVKKDYYEFRKWNMNLSKYQLLDYMMKVDETLTEAYYLKEAYRDANRSHKINSDEDRLEIQQKLVEFIKAFHSSSSPELRRFATTLSNWQFEILNSFIYIDDWRLSNAKIENINGQIKNLMAISYGFTNFERTRTRIIFTINKDYPFSIIKRYESKQKNLTKKRKKCHTPLRLKPTHH